MIAPRLLETNFVASCMTFLLLACELRAARRELRWIGEMADRVTGPCRVTRDVLDEMAGDEALRDRGRPWTRIAVPADDIERAEVDHGDDVVAAARERAERSDDERHDARVVLAVVRPVDGCCAAVGAAENPVFHAVLDLPDSAARLGLDALPRLGRSPQLVVAGARE